MTRRNVWTYLALATSLAAAGCQAAVPNGTPKTAQPQAPAPVAERNIQALDQAGFERMMNALPKQLTNEQAERMLVKLPVGGPQIQTGRLGYRVAGGEAMSDDKATDYSHTDSGAMSNGHADSGAMSSDKDDSAKSYGHDDQGAMSNGHDDSAKSYGNGNGNGHDDKGAMSYGNGHEDKVGHAYAAIPNLDYRYFQVGGLSSPYISYYPYVYNFSNSHWAPYAAYASGRYYYPYYQGYGSLYAPYSYSAIMPYGGVYAMRTGTILR